MALSLETGGKTNPPKILIYGGEGIGKSTFGVQSEKPVFVQTENGLAAYPDLAKYAPAKDYNQFMKNLEEIAFEQHDFKTLVIDSLDWLEPLIWKKLCEEQGVASIEECNGGFAKGFTAALDIWRGYLKLLDVINQERQMTIIQIAHAQIKPYNGPDIQSYDRFMIKLHEPKSGNGASSLLFEYSDIVLFANYRVGVTKDQLAGSTKKNPKERVRGIGAGDRVLYAEERPAFRCKNRFSLPPEIDFDEAGEYWNKLIEAIPYYQQRGK